MKKKHIAFLILLGVPLSFFFTTNASEIRVELIKNKNLTQLDKQSLQNKFRGFISKFKIISYPFTANTGCFEPDAELSVPLDMDNDSIFINYVGPGVAVGMLPDTLNFYAVIYCTAAECYMPNIAIYSKNAKLLSKKSISIGCGAGEGYTCTEFLTVNSLNDIMLVHNTEMYRNDSLGKEISGTYKKTTITNKYFINSKGKIKVVTRSTNSNIR